MTMRKALMKAEGALGRCEFERLKHEYARFQTVKKMCILCLNEVRQSRIPPHFYQPHKVDKCLKQTVILECAEPDCSKIPVKKSWSTVFVPVGVA